MASNFLYFSDLNQFKWFAALAILVSAVVAGSLLFTYHSKSNIRSFPWSRAFAAGVFLGAALLHMLDHAIITFHTQGIDYPVAPALAGVTFLILLWLEHLGLELEHHHHSSSASFALLATLMLSFHAVFEGVALGANHTLATSVILFVAIMAHKWAASFALACQLADSKLVKTSQHLLFIFFCLTTPVAILITDFTVNANPWIEPIGNALAAGTFLYIGTLHGLRKAVMIERCCDLRQFLFVILGFTLMALLALWV